MIAPRCTAAALALTLFACEHQAPMSANNSFGMPPGTVSGGTGAPSGVGPTAGGTTATPGGTVAGRGTTGPVPSTGGATATTPAAGSGTPGTAGPTTTAGTGAPQGGAAAAPQSGGGYIVSGNWKGYAWTGVTGMGSTIMPMDFTGIAAGAPLCVMGSVAVTTDYSAVGMLGVNLNQAATMNAPQMTVAPTGSGLMIDITNTGTSQLRVQVQSPDGDMNPEHRWCAPLAGKGGLMPWTSFNTKCWDNSGTAYAMEPLSTLIVSVPGGITAPIPFNFCLNSVGESPDAKPPAMGAAGSGAGAAGSGAGAAGSTATGTAGSTAPPSPGNPGMGSGMFTGNFDWHNVTRDGRDYIVQNNVWGGGGTQTMTYNGTSFEITARTVNNPTTGQPGSYPSVFIGSNNGHTTNGSNLPKQVSALGSVETSWSHNGSASVSGTYNAAYDVWFSTGAGGDSGAPSGGYLMVWLYKTAGVQPLGNTIAQSGATIPGVEGTWDVWIGQQMGKPCISYVRSQPSTSITYDLNKFIQDAVKRPEKPIQASWYLTNVFAGFEIWSGGTGLKTNSFSAVVQ